VSTHTSTARRRARLFAVAAILGMFGAIMVSSASFGQAGVAIQSARTGDLGNGLIDHIRVTFSVPMNQSTPTVANSPDDPGFYVEGYQIAGFSWASSTTLLVNLVEGSEPDTDATPAMAYTPDSLKSALGNFDPDAQPLEEVEDGAGPVLMSVHAKDKGLMNLFNKAGEKALFGFSEDVQLAGQLPAARWANLEKALKVNGICTDGTGSVGSYNFPLPAGQTAADDPIAVVGNEIRVTQLIDANGSATPAHRFLGVPIHCWFGIDDALQNNSFITDAAGNAASRQTQPQTSQVFVEPLDAEINASSPDHAVTVDGFDSTPDGEIDAIRLIFDQNIDDSTVGPQLRNISITYQGQNATVDTSEVRYGPPLQGLTDNVNDNILFIPFSGVSWDTGVLPTISYLKPETCDAGGAGIKAILPIGGEWRTCLASFEAGETVVAGQPFMWDRAAPKILASRTLDADGNGKLDGVRVTFSEAIAQGTKDGWTIDGQPATGFVPVTDQPNKADITVDEGSTGNTAATPAIAYAQNQGLITKDVAGNQPAAITVTPVDKAAPRIVTATVQDRNADGAVDHVLLEYSENFVEPAASTATGFTVGGVQAASFDPGDGDVVGDRLLTLKVNGLTGTDAKEVAFTTGSIKDALNNSSGAQTVPASDVVDGAPAQGVVSISPTAPLAAGESTVSVVYSEAMDAAVAPTVTLGGEAVGGEYLAEDSSVWEGTITIAEGSCGQPRGCATQALATGAVDLGGLTAADAVKATEIDTMAPQAPTITSFTQTLVAGESAPANTLNMFTKSFQITAGVFAGDAEFGRAEILAGETVVATDPSVGSSDTSVSPQTAYETRADLQNAVPEGTTELVLRLCDDADNCSDPVSYPITVDYTAADVALTSPAGGNVVSGGDTVSIGWDGDEAATDFSKVMVEYSATNGSTWTSTLADDQAADGSYDWTTPTADVADAKVRAVAVDANGNKGYGVLENSFSIDSTAPVVNVSAPKGSSRFLPAGGAFTIRWSVIDASVNRATAPITIEYSNNGGSTWSEINGGNYSHANDGQEIWNVPGGVGYNMRVRVTAVDATGKTGLDRTVRLVRGVAGYVAASNGELVRFGSATANAKERVTKSSWVRGMAFYSSGRKGYTINSNGNLYPFAIGSASKPKDFKVSGVRSGWARDVVVYKDKGGYVLDKQGRLHRFGDAPKARVSKTWSCDCAVAFVLNAKQNGGYVLNAYGKVYPFRLGSASMPKAIKMSNLFGSKIARDVVLAKNGRAGYILDARGRMHDFGGAPDVRSVGAKKGRDAQAIVQVTYTSGYWVNADGVLRPWGAAYGNPTLNKLRAFEARAAAGI